MDGSNGTRLTEGLDLLGLRAPVQRIGNDLFDGITTVTPKVRYLSVLTWIIHRYSQERLPNGWSQFFALCRNAGSDDRACQPDAEQDHP